MPTFFLLLISFTADIYCLCRVSHSLLKTTESSNEEKQKNSLWKIWFKEMKCINMNDIV